MLNYSVAELRLLVKEELLPHPYVNNILKKENQAKTPDKWGKKRLRIFP